MSAETGSSGGPDRTTRAGRQAMAWRVVPVALKDTQINAPRTDRVPILVRQHPRDLVEMGQIMTGPGRQQLRQRDGAERGMRSAPIEICRSEVQAAQCCQIVRSHTRELVEQLVQRCAAPPVVQVPLAIERLEGTALPDGHDHRDARHPVGSLGVNQVGDDVERAPGRGAFVGQRHTVGEAAQQRVERRRGPRQQGEGVGQDHGPHGTMFVAAIIANVFVIKRRVLSSPHAARFARSVPTVLQPRAYPSWVSSQRAHAGHRV